MATDTTITICELLDEWYSWKRGRLAITAQKTTENAIRILKADLGSMTVDALKPRHVDRWFGLMEDRGYKASYAIRIMNTLSSAYRKAVTWDLAISNPVLISEKPKIKTKVRPPTPAVVKKAIAWACKHDLLLWLFLRLDAVAGCRRSELLGLSRDSFDPDLRLLTIRYVVVPGRHGLDIVDYTKTPRGARVISIDAQTCELIEKTLASHTSPWIFPGRNPSKPWYPSTPSHKVSKLGEKLGVHLTPHQLRHYVATELLRQGVPVNVVAARLGDAPATILKTYARDCASGRRWPVERRGTPRGPRD